MCGVLYDEQERVRECMHGDRFLMTVGWQNRSLQAIHLCVCVNATDDYGVTRAPIYKYLIGIWFGVKSYIMEMSASQVWVWMCVEFVCGMHRPKRLCIILQVYGYGNDK